MGMRVGYTQRSKQNNRLFSASTQKSYSCLCCIYTFLPLFLSRILGLSALYNRTAITAKEVVNQKTEDATSEKCWCPTEGS